LNQQHFLPRGISSIVSKTLFWPTLPITFARRLGKWTTQVDDTVIMGGAPIGWLGIPKKLQKQYGVRSVINLCEEYKGPAKQYKRLGIRELRLPTTDHFEPSVEDMKTAVEFIKQHHDNKEEMGKVYVHCRAGHGRAAAIVYGWLMSKEDDVDTIDMERLNAHLCKLRDVRKKLYLQPNINQFHSWLKLRGKPKQDDDNVDVVVDNDDESNHVTGDRGAE
jgi:atypical dual specificity phosphatase